jgi:RimJ/RimL family protein N-acetyltransferase
VRAESDDSGAVELRVALPPGRVDLAGATVRLTALDPRRHAEDLFAPTHGDAAREGVWTFMSYGPFVDQPAMSGWMSRCAASRDPLFLAVTDRDSGRAVGMTSYLNVRPTMGVLEIGHIWYLPAVQRTRVNTESCWLLIRHAFESLGYRRIEWKCDARNERSRAAALRLGFTLEGIFRQHMIVKGRNRDTAWFAMLDGEWPDRRRRLEELLAA